METESSGEDESASQHSPRLSHSQLQPQESGDTEENSDDVVSHQESALFLCEDAAPILSWSKNRNVNPHGLLVKWHSVKRRVWISAAGLCFIIVFVIFPLLYFMRPSTPPSGIDREAQVHSFLTSMMNEVEKAMDTRVDPCHDFYQYACGKWGIINPSVHDVLRSSNFQQMELLLSNAITLKFSTHADPPAGTENTDPIQDAVHFVRSLAVNYYKSCRKEELLSSRGVTPLKDVLSQMDQLYLDVSQKSEPRHAFQKVLEFVHHKLHLHVLFSWKVEADTSVRDAVVIELNVPNVYFIEQGTDLQGKEKLIRTYRQYVKTLLGMVGSFNSSLDNEVDAVLELFKIFRPMNGTLFGYKKTVENLNKLAPFLDWQEYFNSAFNRVGIHITVNEYVFSQIQDYLRILSKHILSEISTMGLERLYVYLRWEVAQFYSQSLHKPARDTILPLIEELSNTNVRVPTYLKYRVHPCLMEVEKRLPLVLHHLVLETVSSRLPKGISINDNIRVTAEIAEIIKKQFVMNIESFTWLNTNVKHFIQEKLSNVNVEVGYPPIVNHPLDLKEYYQDLTLTDNFFTNQMELLKFNQDNLMRLLRRPQMYSDWHLITPTTVTPFYAYRTNAILLPLGGLMHPVFHTYLPAYMAFASIGSLIGHELGHALDTMGRGRNLYGKVNRTIWDKTIDKAFNTRVACRVKQYTKDYYPIRHWLTTNEVLADDASVRTAFMAAATHFHSIWLPDIVMKSLVTLNLSPKQLFFVYYAQVFCSSLVQKENPSGKPKPHPPEKARITATLANTPQFKEVFGCQKGTKMNPQTEDCQIW
ncbi:neprilysin-3-like [Portunus trituberculatus]|uniref:neprilysin-3-like n=1 Tax=Portunus trituberculatus TaxID=210409 RepID=UPI001E1CDE4B|nr:neprilysin-3-like [Portunus trituberculatus]